MSRLARAASACAVAAITFGAIAPAAHSDDTANGTSTGSYSVKPGDYLKGIAETLGVPVRELLAANDLKMTSVIMPGDSLVVPAGGVLPQAPVAPAARYTVVAGDYLSGIAERMGVHVRVLLAANELEMTSVIIPGDTLAVPAGGTMPAPPSAAAAPPAATAPVATPATTPYVVRAGDYLVGIAAAHGVRTGELLSANDLEITSTIQPGQTLQIPPRSLPLPEAKPTAAEPAPSAPAATPVDNVVSFLREQVGKPYLFNADGPEAFDCSGLVRAAFARVGVKLPHYSVLQSTYGTAVDWQNEGVRAGDLVFTTSSSRPDGIGHVGIALDAKRWIQAPGTGDVVRIGPLPRQSSIIVVKRLLG